MSCRSCACRRGWTRFALCWLPRARLNHRFSCPVPAPKWPRSRPKAEPKNPGGPLAPMTLISANHKSAPRRARDSEPDQDGPGSPARTRPGPRSQGKSCGIIAGVSFHIGAKLLRYRSQSTFGRGAVTLRTARQELMKGPTHISEKDVLLVGSGPIFPYVPDRGVAPYLASHTPGVDPKEQKL